MANCSTQELITEAACFDCLSKKELLAVIAQLLCNLNQSGGITAQQVYEGAFADPNGNLAPNDTSKPALYYETSSGTLWQWRTASQTWV